MARQRIRWTQRTLTILACAILWPFSVLANEAPVIDSLTASPPSVAPGGVTTLTVVAHDPDCADTCTTGCGLRIRSDLTRWLVTGGTIQNPNNGDSSSPYTATAEWLAPATEGTYTITVELSDSGSFLCGGRQTTTASIDIQVTLSTNQPPVIESLSAAPTQLYPDQPSALTCVASDPDGDPITYSWSADGGAVTPGPAGSATFEGGSPGIYAVTCTATDTSDFSTSDQINLSVTDAFPESSITAGLLAPQRVAVDSWGDLYVVDRGGLTVVNLFTEELVYHLPLPNLTSVAVDWQDQLLIGGKTGASVVTRAGQTVRVLNPGPPLGLVSAVATDHANRRYAVLHRDTGRVVVYDELGVIVGAFGELSSPTGVAITPEGYIAVGESGHGMIKVFQSDGTLVRSFGALGGGAGEFIRLGDIAVGENGVIYATDTYQDWVQSFDPDGTPREVKGTHGDGDGEFKTPAGVLTADAFNKVIVASLNSSRLEVFRMDGPDPVAPTPNAVLSTTDLLFGPQEVETASDSQTVALTNSGNAPLGIRDVAITGDFSETNDCAPVVDPGLTCTFQVTFRPQTAGTKAGSMNLDTSAGGGPMTVSLTGDGIVPARLTLSPDRLNFPDTGVGSVSEPETAAVTNNGTVPLIISTVQTSEGFGYANHCPAELAGGASCTIDVLFSPNVPQDDVWGTLTVETNGGTDGVTLLGRAVDWDITVVPEVIDFGRVAAGSVSAPQTITATNTGTEFILVTFVTLEGLAQSEFGLDSDTCSGSRLEVGDSCSIVASFAPPEEGPFSASIRIASTATDSPDFVSLEGVGNPTGLIFTDDFETGDLSQWSLMFPDSAVILELSDQPLIQKQAPGKPSSWNPGPKLVGTATEAKITVVNASQDFIDIDPVTLVGSTETFVVEYDECSTRSLEPGEACDVMVVFTPQEAGHWEATLLIPSTLSATPHTVDLVGNAARGQRRQNR